MEAARKDGVPVRGYVSCACGSCVHEVTHPPPPHAVVSHWPSVAIAATAGVAVCPYEGEVAPASVARVAGRLAELGCYEVSLGDTVGQGTPAQIEAMLEAVLGEEEGGGALPPQMLAGHYHDTNGRALENIEVSLRKGVRVFDAAVGGLGGCPYAPGAQGNVATEKVRVTLLIAPTAPRGGGRRSAVDPRPAHGVPRPPAVGSSRAGARRAASPSACCCRCAADGTRPIRSAQHTGRRHPPSDDSME
jgi:isopropylmalate/homocitrate/citramalate synthase